MVAEERFGQIWLERLRPGLLRELRSRVPIRGAPKLGHPQPLPILPAYIPVAAAVGGLLEEEGARRRSRDGWPGEEL